MNTESETDSPTPAPQNAADPSADATCPRCDRKLPADSPSQLCPYCLLAAETCDPTTAWTQSKRRSHFEPPSPEELQPFFETLEVRSMIGRGGMGAVYRAHQHSLGRDVALKILLPEVAVNEGFTDRFLREARALARLGHPNVVAVFDHGTAGPFAYLVMELVEGINLRELMAGQRLPADEALRIVPQLCDALQFAHSRGVIHRDIKPENILIEESGHVKITDFGLAKLAETDDTLGRTATRQVMGTVHYMAPEQIEHPRDVDHRADLYSLGVVFYELLTGELPLGRFGPPSEKAGTTRRVDQVVMKSLEKEPDRRYSSAQEVRSDLDRQDSYTSERARAAARVVDEKMHQATDAVRAAATGMGGSWNSIATFVATTLFYLFVGMSLLFVVTSRYPLVPAIFSAACIWIAAYGLNLLYVTRPLPKAVSFLAGPVHLLARLPRRVYEMLIEGARSIEGLGAPWMIAAVTAFAIALIFLVTALTADDEAYLGVIIAAPIAWWLTRMALPRDKSPKTLPAKLLTYPPILLTLVPVALVFLVWPGFLWLALILDSPPTWFRTMTGINFNGDPAMSGQYFRVLKAQIFGGLTIQSAWLSALTFYNAIFPDHTRWIARPILDEWSGRWSWMLLFGCIIVFALSALMWSI